MATVYTNASSVYTVAAPTLDYSVLTTGYTEYLTDTPWLTTASNINEIRIRATTATTNSYDLATTSATTSSILDSSLTKYTTGCTSNAFLQTDSGYVYLPAGVLVGGGSIENGYVVYNGGVDAKKRRYHDRVLNNLSPVIKTRASLIKNVCEKEKTALETLREIITETEYRKYLKYGFVLVKGISGDTYQIFRNKSHTKVYRGSKLIEEVCVRIKDADIPPTDNVIAFLTMLQAGDEQEFKKLGNVYKFAA
jgi:hypothetical protein